MYNSEVFNLILSDSRVNAMMLNFLFEKFDKVSNERCGCDVHEREEEIKNWIVIGNKT